MITEKQLCKALSHYNGEEVDNLEQVVKITFSGEELLEFVNSIPSEEKEKKADWYRCQSAYRDFVVGRYYRLEIHGEPSPEIQVAFDLRHGYKINPNLFVGFSDSLDGFTISSNPMLDLEHIDYSKLKK